MANLQRLLVANRGEIAIRLLSTARELGIHTITVYTSDDPNHALYADEVALLTSPSDFTNVCKLVEIAVDTKADSVHPGYGFLSENPEFAEALHSQGIAFIGPSACILRRTSDKTDARALAVTNGVPVLPASPRAISEFNKARQFTDEVGLPVMIKAVDGGGGRGIRLVKHANELEDSFNRACGESPSGRVFVEKAAVDGYRHVEVQILGDLQGKIAHLWERECSIQRRFQKIVELAPSTIRNRDLVAKIIQHAMDMAKAINYTLLGTFEFLVHESRSEYFFLEINPRLQVEHTVSEEIAGTDLVRCQLLLAKGVSVESLELPTAACSALPGSAAMQLRITAEDPSKGFNLSMGRVTQFQAAQGVGIRTDTHLSSTKATAVGSSYDSLLAKLIVRSSSFEMARGKALRALKDTRIDGVTTSIEALVGIVASEAFKSKQCSTRWLENELNNIIAAGHAEMTRGEITANEPFITADAADRAMNTAGFGANTILFRKGDAFKIQTADAELANPNEEEYLLRLDRVLTNDFPTQLQVDLTVSSAAKSWSYAINLTSTTQTSVASSRHRKASPDDPTHIALPFSGQLVELLVDEEDEVQDGEIVCVVKQMKMELEVRAPRAGRIKWVCEVDDGETVNEGMLICELVPSESQKVSAKL